MMAGSLARSTIRVEGKDDQWSLIQLLIRHGIDYDARRGWLPEFKQSGGYRELLDGMAQQIKLATGQAVGFVIDADDPLADRWRAVQDRLAETGIQAPEHPPTDGFVGFSSEYKANVGVWLMPDNVHDGKLETFLRELIDENDRLIGYAGEAAREARGRGALFSDADEIKAHLHTWLAWQEEPGNPFGTAIRARYFRIDSPAASRFVAWFKRLFKIDAETQPAEEPAAT